MFIFHWEFTGIVPVELFFGILIVLGCGAVWALRSRLRVPLPVQRGQVERVTYGQSTDVRRRAAYLAQEDELQRDW